MPNDAEWQEQRRGCHQSPPESPTAMDLLPLLPSALRRDRELGTLLLPPKPGGALGGGAAPRGWPGWLPQHPARRGGKLWQGKSVWRSQGLS